MRMLSLVCSLLFLSVLAYAQAPVQDDCELIFNSEIDGSNKQIDVDYHSKCELSFLVIEIFDQWGNHVCGMDADGMEWGDKHLSHSAEWQRPITASDTYYFVAKYRFAHEKDTRKQEGTLFVKR